MIPVANKREPYPNKDLNEALENNMRGHQGQAIHLKIMLEKAPDNCI